MPIGECLDVTKGKEMDVIFQNCSNMKQQQLIQPKEKDYGLIPSASYLHAIIEFENAPVRSHQAVEISSPQESKKGNR